MWDVTSLRLHIRIHLLISTHTSRVGCDAECNRDLQDRFISTHTSRVGCDEQYFEDEELNKFLLTHPVWDVTIGP